MTELRECPFCGGAATLSRFQPGPVWACGCDGCEIGFHGQKQPIVSAWNRRADDWQPIETAPRDGTEAMMWDGMSTRVLHWFEGVYEALWINEEGTPCEGASHWRPLPKGPGG